MADHDVLAFVRANLPAPPCRVLEVGAGEGELAAALAAAGYVVTAIDPDPRGGDVHGVALADVTAEPGTFAAAAAIRSLHHVHPLTPSLERLAEVVQQGAPLVIDEMDVLAFDHRAADWWLRTGPTRLTSAAAPTTIALAPQVRATRWWRPEGRRSWRESRPSPPRRGSAEISLSPATSSCVTRAPAGHGGGSSLIASRTWPCGGGVQLATTRGMPSSSTATSRSVTASG